MSKIGFSGCLGRHCSQIGFNKIEFSSLIIPRNLQQDLSERTSKTFLVLRSVAIGPQFFHSKKPSSRLENSHRCHTATIAYHEEHPSLELLPGKLRWQWNITPFEDLLHVDLRWQCGQLFQVLQFEMCSNSFKSIRCLRLYTNSFHPFSKSL